MSEEERSIFDKILAVLCCKGDVSERENNIKPCSIRELFRFASTQDTVYISIGLTLSAITGILMPLITVLSGLIANVYLSEKTQDQNKISKEDLLSQVLIFVYLYAIAAIIQVILSWIQQYLLLMATSHIVNRLRYSFLCAVLRQDAQWLDKHSSGELSSKLNENIDRIQDGLGEKISLVVRGCLMFTCAIIVSLIYNWKVTLVMFGVGPMSAITMALMGTFSARPMKKYMDLCSKAASLVEEVVMNVKTVAACNGQDEMVKKYSSIMKDGQKPAMQVYFRNGFFEGLFFFVLYFFTVFGVLCGVIDYHDNPIKPGSVIVSANCVLMGAYFLGILGPHMMALLKSRIAAAIIYEIIDRNTNECSLTEDNGIDNERLNGDIVFKNVHFKYATRDTPILNGLSWNASPGQSIALVGHSGCGKSTSVGLLTRLYTATLGEIFVDGMNIDNIDPKILRKNIGIVQQEPCLFNGTIRENIVLGREWKGEGNEDDRLRTVIQISHATQIINKLENGLDTVFGNGGVRLSGGEKQRIAIARALYTDPSILILDEATSALDVQSERLVQEALNEASKGRTTMTIAHRLSTLKNVDMIYVLDKGVVVQQGTHDDLLRVDGIYSNLAKTQSIDQSHQSITEEVNDTIHNVENRLIDLNRFSGRSSLRNVLSLNTSRKETKEVEEYELNKKGDKEKKNGSTFLRMYSHGHYIKILFAIIFSILRGWEIPLYVLQFKFLYSALNAPHTNYSSELIRISCFSFGIGVFVWIALTLAYYFAGWSSESVLARIKERILDKILHQNASYFDKPETSNATIVSDMNRHSSNLIAGLDHRMILFVYCCSSFTACTIISLILHWKLGLVGLGCSLIFVVIITILFIFMTSTTEKLSNLDNTAELAIEMIGQTRTIQLMVAEDYFQNTYERYQQLLFKSVQKISLIQSLIYALSQGGVYFFGFAAFIFGVHFVYYGDIESEDMFTVAIAIEFCGWCISFIYPAFPDLIKANSAARILYRYYDLEKIESDNDSTPSITGSFTANNITFAYPSRPQHLVSKNLSVSASAGESIALVGPSGCGKSTLVGLLERFYDQQNGIIKMDSIDHRSINIRHLRENIALVSQEPVLFVGTIAENIQLGCKNRSIDDVREACRMANAATFIEDLPNGYDTEVGEKGRSLSGGQKQRIAIARALIRKPKLLILDEATSALDAESEKVVQEALSRASHGRTSISIAHRLASIKDVNRIYFIEDGGVVESGTHNDLIDLNGRYAAYVKQQSLGG